MEKINFRKVQPSDLAAVMKIEQASFEAGIFESESTYAERIKTFPDGFMLLEFDGAVIGYICSEIWPYQKEIKAENFTLGHSIQESHNLSGEEIYISSMAILPEYRGQGLGKLMFQKFLEHIQATFLHTHSIILIVSENWERARKIYANNGFTEIDRIKDFFKYQAEEKVEDGIVMRKIL